MSFTKVVLIAFLVSAASAVLVAVVSRTPAEVRLRQEDPAAATSSFTESQIARHARFRGPLYLAFGLSVAAQIVLLILLRGTPMAQLVERVEDLTGGWAARAIVVGAVIAATFAIVGLPLDLIRGFAIPKAWQLSNQDLPAWMIDQAKGLGLSLLFASIAALSFFAVVRWQPRWWWLWGAASFTALTALLVFLFPVAIAPLFNRFTPLEDRALEARIEQLAERAGVAVDKVVVADASTRSTAENAYVAGLGATKQVVLYDTLLAGNPLDETAFVVAHELAHESEQHVLKGVVVSAFGLLGGFALLAWLVGRGNLLRWTGADALVDLRIVPALLLFLLVAGLVARPVQNAISRSFEARADRIAFELTGDPEPAVRAFKRLALSNIADLSPPDAVVWFFFSHPPIADRIEAARATGATKP